MTVSINGTNGLVFSDGTSQNTSPFNGGFGFRNRIINGDMRIDQRNAGGSVTPNNQYVLDRWYINNSQTGKLTVQQNAGSVTPPVGFSNYLGITSTSAYSVSATDIFSLQQLIEGYNFSDFGFGTASAKSVTLSFQVYSSLTGTFGGALSNSANNRFYPFSYTVSSANTWTSVSITIAGDTTGTWVGATNGIGLRLWLNLGTGSTYSGTAGAWTGSTAVAPTGATSVVGTNGATFYITGVQLEKGSTATSFDYRPYGTELALCQRYFETSYPAGTAIGTAPLWGGSVARTLDTGPTPYACPGPVQFKVTKRATPTVTLYGPTGGTSGTITVGATDRAAVIDAAGTNGAYVYVNNISTGAVGNSVGCHYTASSEL